MRRCNYCDKLFVTDFKNCPICGKYTIHWEPVKEEEPKSTPKDIIEKIISFMAHMGD